MSRRAVIFGYPGERKHENYCPGVELDIQRYREFLLSANGGWWFDSEIEMLGTDTTAGAVRTAVNRLKNVDYGLVIFSGHGCYVKSRKTTVLELPSRSELDASELTVGASKQTIILDCCRVVVSEVKLAEHFAKSLAAAKFANGQRCRQVFDYQISLCPKGRVTMYACDVDETAVDTGRGGRYSLGLLNVANDWAQSNRTDPSVLSVVKAHDVASQTVIYQSGGSQNPQIEKPRSEPYYPFAVDAR